MQTAHRTAHPDQRYITGLLDNDRAVIDEIYKVCARQVRTYVCANNGSADDAADLFQDVLVTIYQQASRRELILTCPFSAFLFLVCKRKWLSELKKRAQLPVTNVDNEGLALSDNSRELAEELEEEQTKEKRFLSAFEKLGERCKEIIRLSMLGGAQEKVAEQLGVTYGYLRKKKSECMATLVKLVQ